MKTIDAAKFASFPSLSGFISNYFFRVCGKRAKSVENGGRNMAFVGLYPGIFATLAESMSDARHYIACSAV